MDQKSILIVDDEADICEIIASRLEEEGFGTVTASNGQEALEKLKKSDIGLIISDIRMPLMDGMALLKQLKEDYEKPPHLIFLSGFSDVSPKEALKRGAFKFLNKPIEMAELVLVVKEAFQG